VENLMHEISLAGPAIRQALQWVGVLSIGWIAGHFATGVPHGKSIQRRKEPEAWARCRAYSRKLDEMDYKLGEALAFRNGVERLLKDI